MDKLRVFETFAGIGAQHKALSRIGIEYEVVATSEWDIDAILAYNAIHKPKGETKFNKNIDVKKFTFSSNGKEPISNIDRLSLEKRKLLFKACEENKNYGSIVDLKAKDLPVFDLLTYSFPCQDLSIASMGRGKGMGREAESRSGLLWQIERILKEIKELEDNKEVNFLNEEIKLPKYLLLENVSAMLHQNNIEHYEEWLEELKNLGYITFTTKLRADYFGVPQKRERVFAISIKVNNDEKDLKEYFNVLGMDNDKKVLNTIAEKIISNSTHEEVKCRKPLQKILDEGHKYHEELLEASPNHTPSRYRMREQNFNLEDENVRYVRTLTTKQDRHPNAGMVEFKHGKVLNKEGEEVDREFRFLTPRESYMLMGFDSKDYSRVRKLVEADIIKKEKTYQQAGNSIVVNVLEAIFKTIWEIENER